MRSFLIKASLITGFGILLLLSTGIALAKFAPLHPGNLFFSIQNFSEQQVRRIYPDPNVRAAYMLDLVERRIHDLILRTGSKYELAAMQALDKSLDQAVYEISLIPQSESSELVLWLLKLMTDSDNVLRQLTSVTQNQHDYYILLRSKIDTFIRMNQSAEVGNSGASVTLSTDSNTRESAGVTPQFIFKSGGLVPFPPGSAGARHEFYPLVGQHALLSCEGCHKNGKYNSTPNACINCHVFERPIPHYSGKCDLCHSPNNWLEIHFDHTNSSASLCSTCHLNEKPVNHYSGQCSACHITQAWNLVTFDHAAAGATNCTSCHVQDAPANHYFGQCSNCHNTNNWASAVFNHAGFSDCVSCHVDDSPANHFSGQCSNCHNTDSSWQNASFNHSGYSDCISCHGGAAPANHFQGQCSNCHNADSSWQNASFNHIGYSDCISCHGGTAPANHFQGQCSNCHSTDTWDGANINHDNLTECTSCHLGDRPDSHDQGDCAQCHSYPEWDD